jgi:N-acetylneuraminate synthase/N,N'-diacetyllegionaminate synthase
MKITIGDRCIGDEEPCFVIAEAGVNHNGDIKLAKKLINIAHTAGADAVKFQTWITDEVVTTYASKASYQKKNTGNNDSQYNMLKALELSFDDFIVLKKYAEKKHILFLSSADDEKSADFLDELGIPLFKVGSGILNNTPMLKHLAKKDKPIILSTGMATLSEVKEAVKTIKAEGNDEVILLHCTSDYPAQYKDVNLNAMLTLKKTFKTIVGYSDHTLGLTVPILATALGAKVIEKHYTFNKHAPGVDQAASLDPAELKKMIAEIRNAELALGSFEKKPTKPEIEIAKVARESIVAAIDIPKGTKLSETLLATKRPGTGIPPTELYHLIGKISQNKIKKDELISWNMVR